MSAVKRFVVWKDKEKTVGVIVEDSQMAYELRKGALNSLGIVTMNFVESWAEMTAYDNCFIEELELKGE